MSDWDSSWTSLTNHTPQSQNLRRQDSDTIEKRFSEVPLSTNRGRVVRDDVVLDDELCSWLDASHIFDNYLEDKEDLSHILESEGGERIYIDNSHRFEEHYKKKQMAKFYAVERIAKEKYGKENLKTVMLTLTASPYDSSGNLLPPIDHLDSIMDSDTGSWSSVRSSLYRCLEGFEWEYMRILEPMTPDSGDYATSGYAHQHIGIVVSDPDDELDSSDFEPALESHVRNCKTAGKEAHKTDKQISVISYDDDKEGGLGAYLTAYMGKMTEKNPRECDAWYKRFLTLLWASNRRRVDFSNGANKWIREDRENQDYENQDSEDKDSESSENQDWSYIGIRTTDGFGDEKIVEVDEGGSGGYTEPLRAPRISSVSNIWTDPP